MNTPGTAETIREVQALVFCYYLRSEVCGQLKSSLGHQDQVVYVRPRGLSKGGNFRDVLKTGSTGLNEVRDN